MTFVTYVLSRISTYSTVGIDAVIIGKIGFKKIIYYLPLAPSHWNVGQSIEI